jgi:hypothetical protein
LYNETNSKYALEENAMKKILSLAGITGLAIAAISTQVIAVTHTVGLSATVSPSCTVATPPSPSGTGFSGVTATNSSYAATITNSVAVASSGTLEFPAVSCNGGNIKVTLNPMGTALVSANSPGTNQTNRIDYTALAKVNNLQTVTSINTSVNLNIASGNSGETSGSIQLILSILPTPTGKTLVTGNYAGTLKIDFDPV